MSLEPETLNSSDDSIDVRVFTAKLPNSLSADAIAALNEICDQVEDAGYSSVLLIQPDSDNAGIPDSEDNIDIHRIRSWEKLIRRIETLDALSIFAANSGINSVSMAGLLVSDYRIVSDHVNFSLADENQNIMPGMLLHRLAHQLGIAHSRQMILLGNPMGAETAKALGLIDEVSVNIPERITHLIESLEPNCLPELSMRRRLLYEASSTHYEDALGVHLAACDRLLRRQKAH